MKPVRLPANYSGAHEERFKDGTLSCKGAFLEGRKTGEWAYFLKDGKLKLTFRQPQRAIVPGQICALYEGGRMLGGGVFESVG